MRKLILLTPLFILLTGCDAPQRTRAPSTWVNGNTLENNNGNGTFTPGPGTTTGSTQSGSTSGTGSGTPTSPGFENCDLSQKYHTNDIGFFGVCQSSQDETSFKFNPSLTSTTRTCLIPTYKDGNGSSTYIGNPQCTLTTSNQVISGKLYKDRQGFSSYPLNGLIVMKEPLLPEYYNCMQGYVNWPRNACPNGATTPYCAYWVPRCPYGGQSNQGCDTEGRNYMASLCNAFKAKYSNSYIDIRLK
ncbi:MAG: hypothetical protein ACLGHN_00560 [Bacteriovoracia bacterium]